MPTVNGVQEERLLGVASAKVLTESPPLQAPPAAELWGKLLVAEVAYLGGVEGGEGGAHEGPEEEEEYAGYSAAYARLHNAHKWVAGAGAGAGACASTSTCPLAPTPHPPHTHAHPRPERDVLPDVPDARSFLARALAKYSAAQPGRVPQALQAALTPEQQQQLAAWCQAAGVSIA